MHVSVITLVFNIILLPVVLEEFGNFSHIHKLRVLPEAHSKILEVQELWGRETSEISGEATGVDERKL